LKLLWCETNVRYIDRWFIVGVRKFFISDGVVNLSLFTIVEFVARREAMLLVAELDGVSRSTIVNA